VGDCDSQTTGDSRSAGQSTGPGIMLSWLAPLNEDGHARPTSFSLPRLPLLSSASHAIGDAASKVSRGAGCYRQGPWRLCRFIFCHAGGTMPEVAARMTQYGPKNLAAVLPQGVRLNTVRRSRPAVRIAPRAGSHRRGYIGGNCRSRPAGRADSPALRRNFPLAGSAARRRFPRPPQ
jgi:hypothetical protein